MDGWRHEITIERPRLPAGVNGITARGIEVAARTVSLAFERSGERVLVDKIDDDLNVRVSARL